MRLLVQEAQLHRWIFSGTFWDLLSLKLIVCFEYEVSERGVVFLENAGSETLFPHQLDKICSSHLPVQVTETLPAASLQWPHPVFSQLNSCSQSCRPLPPASCNSVLLACPEPSGGGMGEPHVLGKTASSPSSESPLRLLFGRCLCLRLGGLG